MTAQFQVEIRRFLDVPGGLTEEEINLFFLKVASLADVKLVKFTSEKQGRHYAERSVKIEGVFSCPEDIIEQKKAIIDIIWESVILGWKLCRWAKD